jgi:hypothetical protein
VLQVVCRSPAQFPRGILSALSTTITSMSVLPGFILRPSSFSIALNNEGTGSSGNCGVVDAPSLAGVIAPALGTGRIELQVDTEHDV